MIPPLFLDICSHHKVLDLCAAPGSKTTQIIEALHQSHAETLQRNSLTEPVAPDQIPNPLPLGFVVANDSDNKRSYLLVHQAKRTKSANVIVTNHDGTIFPNLHLSEEDRISGTHVRYDRVLCDVPCSGDGTIRKNPTVWKKWAPHKGNGLHRLQLRLVVRGAELLVVGGRLVYSTCSMNPIENEAVIHTLLKLGEGSLQLMEVSLPSLEKRPGLKGWKVMSNANVWVDEEESDGSRGGVYPTFFPPASDQADSYSLDRCMRVYPHLQNTGGFFIAVIQKIAPLPWMKENKNRDSQAAITSSVDPPISSESSTDTRSAESENKLENRPFGVFGKFSAPSGYRGYKEDPFIFVDRSDELIAGLSSFYGLLPCFPWEHCFTRSEGKAKNNIYITNSLVAKILATNQANKNVVKLVNTGLRVFCRSDLSAGSPSRLRLSQDGCNLFINYVSKRRIRIHESDLIKMLASESVSLSDFSVEGLNEIRDVSLGPVVFLYNPSPNSSNYHTSATAPEEPRTSDQLSNEGVIKKQYKCFITSPVIFSGWKANWSARLFVTREEKQHFQAMLGYELLSDVSLKEKKMSRLVRCQNRVTNEPLPPCSPPSDELTEEREQLLSDDNKL